MFKVTMEPVVDGSDFFGFEIKVDGIVIDKADDFQEARRLKEKYIRIFHIIGKKQTKVDKYIGLIALIFSLIILLIKFLS